MPVYAHCPYCGLDFVSEALGRLRMIRVTLSDVTENCPRCGQPAVVMEGTFNSSAEHIEVLSGPEWSRELVNRMQVRFREIEKIASSVRIPDAEADAKIQQILAEVEAANPVVAAEFRARTTGQPRKAWTWTAKAITAALAAVGAYNTISDFSDRVAGLISYFTTG